MVGACSGRAIFTHILSQPSLRPRVLPLHMQQPETQQRKALVHRGGIGIGPHVHAASALVQACVKFFASLRARPAATIVPPPRTTPPRTATPLFINNTLCERIEEEGSGHVFCLCQDKIDSDEYTCRRAVRDGRWIYYCTTTWP